MGVTALERDEMEDSRAILEMRGQLQLATNSHRNDFQVLSGAFRETVMTFPETGMLEAAGFGETITAFELHMSGRHPWGDSKETASNTPVQPREGAHLVLHI